MHQLRTARQSRGWTQARAAARLGVSQPYLAMLEAGQRPLTPAIARRAMRVYGLPPTVLPPAGVAPRVTAETLARDLAALGYPGFAHLGRGGAAKHPEPARVADQDRPGESARLREERLLCHRAVQKIPAVDVPDRERLVRHRVQQGREHNHVAAQLGR